MNAQRYQHTTRERRTNDLTIKVPLKHYLLRSTEAEPLKKTDPDSSPYSKKLD